MFEQSIKEGQESELKFAQLAKRRGFLVEPATGMEQFDHIDFHLTTEEEEGTIYGINNNCLIINDTIITENQIRKEFGLLPRVSHNSQELFIYDVPQFFSKRDEYNKTICKQMFFV